MLDEDVRDAGSEQPGSGKSKPAGGRKKRAQAQAKPGRNLYKRGSRWYFKKEIDGRLIRRPLETSDYVVAKKRRDALEAELAATAWGEEEPPLVTKAARRFAKEHFPTLRPRSAQRYVTSLSSLLKAFDGLHMHELTPARLLEYEVERREEDNVSNSTIRRDFACLGVMFNYCLQWEWVSSNPMPTFMKARSKAGLKEGAPRTRYLSHDEESRVLSHARDGIRDAIIFAIDTGLRLEEQRALTWDDVDFKRREIYIAAAIAKGRRERFVPIQARTLEILKRRYKTFLRASEHGGQPSRHVFTAVTGNRYSATSSYFWEALQIATQRAGISDHVLWHDLRRTCGCRLLQDRKMSMEEVSRWLGHASVVVTERHYAFLAKDALHKRLKQSRAVTIPIRPTGRKPPLKAYASDTKRSQTPKPRKSHRTQKRTHGVSGELIDT